MRSRSSASRTPTATRTAASTTSRHGPSPRAAAPTRRSPGSSASSRPDDLFDVPARLAAAQLRFRTGDGEGALDLLLPLFARKGTYVARRALRITLDALETKSDAVVRSPVSSPRGLPRRREKGVAWRLSVRTRSRRPERPAEAAALREELLREGRRDDAAAVVLAREMRGTEAAAIPDRLLRLLIDAARAQRDLEMAERLLVERDRRAVAGTDVDERELARFDLGRLYAARGRFAEAAAVFRGLLADRPARLKAREERGAPTPPARPVSSRASASTTPRRSRSWGTPRRPPSSFGAPRSERTGPWRLAMLQRARILTRDGTLRQGRGDSPRNRRFSASRAGSKGS